MDDNSAGADYGNNFAVVADDEARRKVQRGGESVDAGAFNNRSRDAAGVVEGALVGDGGGVVGVAGACTGGGRDGAGVVEGAVVGDGGEVIAIATACTGGGR